MEIYNSQQIIERFSEGVNKWRQLDERHTVQKIEVEIIGVVLSESINRDDDHEDYVLWGELCVEHEGKILPVDFSFSVAPKYWYWEGDRWLKYSEVIEKIKSSKKNSIKVKLSDVFIYKRIEGVTLNAHNIELVDY